MSRERTVLLIEDNEDSRIILTAFLTSSGYLVTEATNGEAGIAKARADRPDLILMDVSIPIIDGWEATRILKHDPDTAKIPIVALTVHALPSDREKAMEVGCDDYISKPVEPRAGSPLSNTGSGPLKVERLRYGNHDTDVELGVVTGAAKTTN